MGNVFRCVFPLAHKHPAFWMLLLYVLLLLLLLLLSDPPHTMLIIPLAAAGLSMGGGGGGRGGGTAAVGCESIKEDEPKKCSNHAGWEPTAVSCQSVEVV